LIKRNALILLFVIVVGIAAWQNYQLQIERKETKQHVAATTMRAAYFLYTTSEQISIIKKEEEWVDQETRESLQHWIAYTYESLVNANAALQAFPSLVSADARTDMNDVFFKFSTWQINVSKILKANSGPLTDKELVDISELSRSIAKVDHFYTGKYDWEENVEAFSRLDEEWAATGQK
jgi:hypothetical protein